MRFDKAKDMAQHERRQSAGDHGQLPLHVRVMLNKMGQQQRAGGAERQLIGLLLPSTPANNTPTAPLVVSQPMSYLDLFALLNDWFTDNPFAPQPLQTLAERVAKLPGTRFISENADVVTLRNDAGQYTASVSIRSGRGSGTHDRVFRFVPLFASAESALAYAVAEGHSWLAQRHATV